MVDTSQSKTFNEEDLIIFDEGILGFEEYKRFLPLPIGENSGNIISLESVDDENLTFLLLNPFALNIDYNPKLEKEDYKKLKTDKDEDLSFYVICVLANDIEKVTINLKCPIVVNALTRKAFQVILQTDEYSLRHSFKSLAKEG